MTTSARIRPITIDVPHPCSGSRFLVTRSSDFNSARQFRTGDDPPAARSQRIQSFPYTAGKCRCLLSLIQSFLTRSNCFNSIVPFSPQNPTSASFTPDHRNHPSIMFPELTASKHPIAIRDEHVVDQPTTIRVQQHGKGLSEAKFTVLRDGGQLVNEKASAEPSPPEAIFQVDGKVLSSQGRRHFTDASGLPIFELYHKFSSATWFVELPGGNDTAIVRLAPRSSSLKDDLEVMVRNAAANAEETTLRVRGQDIWKQRANVEVDGKVVMTVKKTDKWSSYLPGRNPEWQVDLAAGMDVSLASVIVIVMAANMYDSNMHLLGSS